MRLEQPMRLPIVGVIGSGTNAHSDKAEPLGTWLARQGMHLLTGGGGGVMASVSRAFFEVPEREGLVIGVIPGSVRDGCYGSNPGYPNQYVEVPIFTHLPLSGTRGTDPMSRNHINILSSDVLVALPGAAGTASEVRLALTYKKPFIVFCDRREDIEGLPHDVPVEPDFEKVKSFVLASIKR